MKKKLKTPQQLKRQIADCMVQITAQLGDVPADAHKPMMVELPASHWSTVIMALGMVGFTIDQNPGALSMAGMLRFLDHVRDAP